MPGHSRHWLRRKRSNLPPAQPDPPTPSNVTSNGATLSWTLVPGASFYNLEQSTTGLDGSWGPVSPATPTSALTWDVDSLTGSSLYYFRLTAGTTKGGNSTPSEATVITLGTSQPPDTPTAPTFGVPGNTTVAVSWAAVNFANTYTLQRALVSGGGYSNVFGPSTLRTFTDSNLTAATGYNYRIVATNADGTATGPAASVTTANAVTPPATPAKPTSSNISSGSANITWVAVSGATDYELQRRQTGPAGAGIPTAYATVYGPGPQTQFLDINLAPSSTYDYKVRAINSAGNSAYSPVLTVITGANNGTNVQPVSALYLRQNSGVATHPNFNTDVKVWKVANAPEYIELIYQGGWGFIRGSYPIESIATTYRSLLRARKMKWIMGIVGEASGAGVQPPTNDTIAETRATVRAIREDAADLCAGIEGINEPNQNRGSGTTVSNWAQITVNHQQAIWQEAKWNLTSVNGPIGSSPTAGSVLNPLRNAKIYGPSLHDIACENSYGPNPPNDTGPRHWHQLLDEGILNFQDAAGFHCYPGAGIPLRGARNLALIDEGNLNNGENGNATGRLELMWSAYGDRYPSYTTEWGYHNAVAQTGGHIGIDERGSGIYYPRGYIQMLTQPFRLVGTGLNNNTACTGFEFLDDQDDGAKDAQELNFGIYGYNSGTDARDPDNWRPKPQYTKTKAFLNHMGREPLDDPDYVPNRVFLGVSTNSPSDLLEWQVFASKAQSDAGIATVAIYRRNKVWNRSTKTVVNVPTIPVTITDRVGPHPTTYQVGGDVLMIDLR